MPPARADEDEGYFSASSRPAGARSDTRRHRQADEAILFKDPTSPELSVLRWGSASRRGPNNGMISRAKAYEAWRGRAMPCRCWEGGRVVHEASRALVIPFAPTESGLSVFGGFPVRAARSTGTGNLGSADAAGAMADRANQVGRWGLLEPSAQRPQLVATSIVQRPKPGTALREVRTPSGVSWARLLND